MASARTDFGAWFKDQGPKASVSGDLEGGAEAPMSGGKGFLGNVGMRIPTFGQAQPPASNSEQEWTFGMTVAQRWQAMAMLMAGSCLLYTMSIFVFLPMLLFAPAKFASAFTFASIMWVAGLACVRGPRATLASMVSNGNRMATAGYVGSMALTLYATLSAQSYLLTLLAVAIQMAAAAWYSASFFPGGNTAAGYVATSMVRPLTRLLPFVGS